jgi:hypothetical protein
MSLPGASSPDPRPPVVTAIVAPLRRRLRPVYVRARRIWLRLRPLRPPVEATSRLAALAVLPDHPFIAGNGFAARCRYVLNYDVLSVNEDVDDEWWFCKTDFLEYFFRKLAPKRDFVLFTHNSDLPVDEHFERRLGDPHLVAWFAENAAFHHPKLYAIPLGIANPHRVHGDGHLLRAAQSASTEKTTLFNTSFAIGTNVAERTHCIEQTGLQPGPRKPYADYLADLGSSYFCLSPRGNGIDCLRTWEALYLRSIPVVTRSVLTDQHPDIPMIVLDDWAEFSSIDFSPELYRKTWGDWDPEAIELDPYMERVRRTLQGVDRGLGCDATRR